MNIQISNNTFTLDSLRFDGTLSLTEFELKVKSFILEWFSNHSTMIFQSSGSTGKPKKIEVSKENLKASALRTLDFCKHEKTNCILNVISFDHIGGAMQIIRAIVGDLNLIILPAKKDPFSNHTIDWDKILLLSLVPYQMHELCSAYTKQLQKCSYILLGGAATDDVLNFKLKDLGFSNTYETYGMTETLSHIALRNCTREKNFKIMEGISISTNDNKCLVIDDKKLKLSNLETNDIIEIIDKEHFLWKGRFDNIINSGGIKLSPEQIENKLKAIIPYPFFLFGLAHTTLGQSLNLIIETTEIDNDLKSKISNSSLLNNYEKPKFFYTCSQFIRSKNDKILRLETLKNLDIL